MLNRDSFPYRVLRLIRRLLMMLLLVSLLAAMLQAAALLPVNLRDSPTLLLVLAGLAFGLVVFAACVRIGRHYVFGHELTHWLTAKLFRRQTQNFQVGATGGSVVVRDINLWIVLAPYFVPLYAICWLAAGMIARIWYHPPWFDPTWLVGIGVWYAYHVVLTTMALSEGQPDLEVFGKVYSLLLIVTINVAILYVALMAFSGLWREGLAALGSAYASQGRWLWGLIQR